MNAIPDGVHTRADLARHYAAVRHRLMAQRGIHDPEEYLRSKKVPGEKPEFGDFPIFHTLQISFRSRFDVMWTCKYNGNIADLIVRLPPSKHTIRDIAQVVADFYRVTITDMLSRRRTARIVRPKHVCYYLTRTLTAKTLPEIGRAMGGRDHTSIMHGCGMIAERIKTDTQLRNEVEQLTAILGVAA